jgi:hypothetical protein
MSFYKNIFRLRIFPQNVPQNFLTYNFSKYRISPKICISISMRRLYFLIISIEDNLFMIYNKSLQLGTITTEPDIYKTAVKLYL